MSLFTINEERLKEELAFRSGFCLIPNRGLPQEGFGLMGKWQWLYPDGSIQRELPDLKIIAKFLIDMES